MKAINVIHRVDFSRFRSSLLSVTLHNILHSKKICSKIVKIFMPAAHGVSTQTIVPVEIVSYIRIFRVPIETSEFLLRIVLQNHTCVCSLVENQLAACDIMYYSVRTLYHT